MMSIPMFGNIYVSQSAYLTDFADGSASSNKIKQVNALLTF